MMIQYPFNWKRIVVDDKALIFLPPSKNDKFSENLLVALFGINSSISAGQLSGQAINNYGEYYSDFFVIYSKPITFEGDPAYVLFYTYTSPVAGKIIAMDIGIKDGNKAYVISYSAEQPEYYTYIPTIEKMIDSFHLISM
jgi:serine/threonine-protein kinase